MNDLDLEVVDPSGGVHAGNDFNTRADATAAEPEVGTGGAADTVNPVEKVRIANPAAGTWTIRVKAGRVAMGPQGYGLAVTGRLSAPTGPTFVPGIPRQADVPGNPTISDVVVNPVDAGTAQVTFSTSEPTTALVRSGVAGVAGGTVDHVDSYNLGPNGYPGIEGDKGETSAAFADRPVLGTKHEVTVTGLAPDEPVPLSILVADQAGLAATLSTSATTPSRVVGVRPGDEALLYSDAAAGGFGTSTQLYVGTSSGADLLGALLFRVPATIDPGRVTGASIELTSMHDLTSHYTDAATVAVDLLAPAVEPGFTALAHDDVASAASTARLQGQTGLRVGGYQRYDFAVDCAHLARAEGHAHDDRRRRHPPGGLPDHLDDDAGRVAVLVRDRLQPPHQGRRPPTEAGAPARRRR